MVAAESRILIHIIPPKTLEAPALFVTPHCQNKSNIDYHLLTTLSAHFNLRKVNTISVKSFLP